MNKPGRGKKVEPAAMLQNSPERLALQRFVDEAERDIAEGQWIEHAEVVAKLRRWAGDCQRDLDPENC